MSFLMVLMALVTLFQSPVRESGTSSGLPLHKGIQGLQGRVNMHRIRMYANITNLWTRDKFFHSQLCSNHDP